MFKFLARLRHQPAPALPPRLRMPPPLDEAMNNEDVPAARRRASLLAHGAVLPAAELIELCMPRDVFERLSRDTPAAVHSTAVLFNGADKAQRQCLQVQAQGDLLSISHHVQNGAIHRLMPDGTTAEVMPFFSEVARLTGVIEGANAYVAASQMVHIYGAFAHMPASAQQIGHFRQLRRELGHHWPAGSLLGR